MLTKTSASILILAGRLAKGVTGSWRPDRHREPGKIEDLVAFSGDPTTDIGACALVVAVFQAGEKIR